MQAEREFNGISVNVPSLKWIMYIGPFNNFYLTISCDILSILCKRQNFEISATIFLNYGFYFHTECESPFHTLCKKM